jgi:uncharacterized protein YceK
MTTDEPRPESEFVFEDEFDYLFANTSPNPNREGCPPQVVLLALSRREKPIGDPGYLHIVRCSPCFREFRTLQQARKAQTRRRRYQVLAIAAVVVLAVGASWVMLRPGGGEGTSQSARAGTSAPARDARLDLRPFRVLRGDQPGAPPAPSPLDLPRARVDATLLLPVGADEGAYELRLLDRDLTPRLTASGTAAIVNFVTTLRATLDLQSIEPGMYQLGIRRAGGEWQMFPAQVR